MVRTNTAKLSVIKEIAYRQKLPAGGSGIVILREDAARPGIASISKTSGEAIPSANTSKKLYPKEAFQEAIELTAGLPYNRQQVQNNHREPGPDRRTGQTKRRLRASFCLAEMRALRLRNIFIYNAALLC